MTIDYKTTVNYEGRNGLFKQVGMKIENYKDNVVTLFPINSKKKVGNGMLEIPKESIQDFIDALKQYL